MQLVEYTHCHVQGPHSPHAGGQFHSSEAALRASLSLFLSTLPFPLSFSLFYHIKEKK